MARVLWGEEYATLLLVQNDGKTLEPVPRACIPEDARIYVGSVGRMNNADGARPTFESLI